MYKLNWYGIRLMQKNLLQSSHIVTREEIEIWSIVNKHHVYFDDREVRIYNRSDTIDLKMGIFVTVEESSKDVTELIRNLMLEPLRGMKDNPVKRYLAGNIKRLIAKNSCHRFADEAYLTGELKEIFANFGKFGNVQGKKYRYE